MPSAVADIFGARGPIAGALGADYEPRPEQIAMAQAVERTLEARSHLLVEAGTGVGKSFAYLVPAILRCVRQGEVVVIATNTIALQEQLVQKDIPALQAALESAGVIPPASSDPPAPPRPGPVSPSHPLRPVLVKGRGNYVSIRRLRLASQRHEGLLPDAAAREQLHAIEDWAYDTRDGSLATLPRLERPEVWSHVESDADNCMGRKCPHFGACFYQNARRAMEQGNLLICNHALFFADLGLRRAGAGLLPDYQHVILDEAHQVEDVAAEHLGASLAEGRVVHLLRTLYEPRRRKGYLGQLAGSLRAPQTGEAVERAIRMALDAGEASRQFFDSWLHRFESGQLPGGRIREPGAVENPLSPALRALAVSLKALRETVPGEADKFELQAYASRAGALADAAEAIVGQALPGCAYWIEVTRGGRAGRTRVALGCAPIEVGPILKEHLFSGSFGVVLTSATLATGGALRAGGAEPPPVADRAAGANGQAGAESPSSEGVRSAGPFAHAARRLGCEGADTLLLGSPFEYARQVTLHLARDMPAPPGDRARPDGAPLPGAAYIDRLAARILEHIDATDGGAFVLFTSFATLEGAARALEAPLAERGMPLLVQRPDGPRAQLLAAFRANPRSVLLGAASFWQGVDVRGENLRNVIITRLPFEPPGRPLTEARLELIQSRGGNPFMEDSLPRAIIRFKQGFGRLIRSKTDRGRVVVLDPRIVTARYGRAFLAALPEGVRVADEPEITVD